MLLFLDILMLLLPVMSVTKMPEQKTNDVGFHCCSPNQWTARVRADSTTIKDSVMTHNETWMSVHYDSANQRIAYTDVTNDREPPYYQRTIEVYKHHSWTIVVNKDVCVIYNLTGSFVPKCTPHNISLMLFAVAPILNPGPGVFANTAYFSRPGVTGHMTVTVGDCALIEEVTYDLSMKGVSAVDNVQYFNQTLHVEDSVFTIPHNCIYVPPDDTNHHANRHWTHMMPRYFH